MQPVEQAKRTQSLTNRLVWSLFLRQLLFILTVNALLLTTCAVGLVWWAEHWTTQAAGLIEERGIPSEEARLWMEVSNFEIVSLDREIEGISIVGKIPMLASTEKGLRNFKEMPFYQVEFQDEGETYAIVVNLKAMMSLMRVSFGLLLLVEFFFLTSSIFGNNRSIHRTLKPLHELAITAVRLNSVGRFSQQEMETLAGELEKINALHLDSRISLPDTHRELKTLAGAINSMLDRVTDAYSAQMRFVSDASHELRTPIAVIQGYSAMVDRWGKEDPETLQEAIDAIRAEASSMEKLIEQLLFLARGDNQSQPIHKEEMDLSHTATEVLREEAMLFPEHVLLPEWDGDFLLTADPSLMKQLLRILMDNSLKYTPNTGRVWLKLEKSEDYITVTIQDEGMGIAEESLPLIFQRFYRTDSSRTRQTGGTGLGLSIAQWIVSVHGGWFELLSRVEIGTQMKIYLPVQGTELPDPLEFAPKIARSQANTHSIE